MDDFAVPSRLRRRRGIERGRARGPLLHVDAWFDAAANYRHLAPGGSRICVHRRRLPKPNTPPNTPSPAGAGAAADLDYLAHSISDLEAHHRPPYPGPNGGLTFADERDSEPYGDALPYSGANNTANSRTNRYAHGCASCSRYGRTHCCAERRADSHADSKAECRANCSADTKANSEPHEPDYDPHYTDIDRHAHRAHAGSRFMPIFRASLYSLCVTMPERVR
jgi:hypothetical protein